MKYPIGIQTFERIRKEGYVYVDKTALIYKMVSEGSIYFLSRPRRFGKSLLVSTLRAYFEGRKDLFEGLAIDQLEKDWNQYPVFHFDFNGQNFTNQGELEKALNARLGAYEKEYGSDPLNQTFGDRFKHLIEAAYQQKGRKVVVLVDGSDKPILDVLDTPLEDENRDILKGFYSTFKAADASLHFVFLTGINKFSLASEFGGFNQAEDISMTAAFDTLCGITEEELFTVFAEPIREMADEMGISEEEVKMKLKKQYDGYHFSSKMRDVYNPYSVLNALDNKDFRSYWFASGTPTYLVKLLARSNKIINSLNENRYSERTFANYCSGVQRPLPMMYQSGYLTIKDFDPEDWTYRLDFPNKEVRAAWRELGVVFSSETRTISEWKEA